MIKPMQRGLFLIGLSLMVLLRVVFLLPSLLDFRNFAFRDLGSFQHVDLLIAQGLRPGVDFGFIYGLLGVLLQHICFAVFGASHWPTLGLFGVYVFLMLIFWILFSLEMGPTITNFLVLLGLSGFMIYIAPWPPTPAHELQQLSLAFSLYFLLKRRPSLALFVAALGALAHPGLPLIMAGLIALVIVWEWWHKPDRTVRDLAAQFVPASVAYAAVAALMAAFFGWRALLLSLSPTNGARLYRATSVGFFKEGRNFWYPPHAHLSYYLFTPAGVWILCSGLLVVFGCLGAFRIFRAGRAVGSTIFVVVCCAFHLLFVFVAFGNSFTYAYDTFCLAAGVLAGVSGLTSRRLRIVSSTLLLGFGLLSQLNGISEELQLWKGESASRATASLYAPNDFQPEWSGVLSIAQDRRVFMLAYGTGVDLYYPEIGSAESWMLLPGLLMPREESFVLRQVNAADIVVEEREVTTLYTEHDKELQAALGRFSVKLSGKYFRIWTNDPTARTELLKTAAFHAE